MSRNLPEGIYARVFSDRVDLLRVVVVGPSGTPYQDGLFIYDFQFPGDYPSKPPMVFDNRSLTWVARGLGWDDLISSNRYDCSHEIMCVPEEGVGVVFDYLLRNELSSVHGKNLVDEFIDTANGMFDILRNPPRHFDGLVHQHFRLTGNAILDAFDAYKTGRVEMGKYIDYHSGSCSESSSSATDIDALNTDEVKKLQQALTWAIKENLKNPVKLSEVGTTQILEEKAEGSEEVASRPLKRNRSLFSSLRLCLHMTFSTTSGEEESKPTKLKRFEQVSDFSDHTLRLEPHSGVDTTLMWNEWMILLARLPESMYVRVYNQRMDLLRAVIIHQNELFVLDLQFPKDYPKRPPVVVQYPSGHPVLHRKVGWNDINPPNVVKLMQSIKGRGSKKDDKFYKIAGLPEGPNVVQVLEYIQNVVLIYRSSRGVEGESNVVEFFKTYQSMVSLLKNPPLHVEDIVCSHFRQRRKAILAAFKAEKPTKTELQQKCDSGRLSFSPPLATGDEELDQQPLKRSDMKRLHKDLVRAFAKNEGVSVVAIKHPRFILKAQTVWKSISRRVKRLKTRKQKQSKNEEITAENRESTQTQNEN